MNERDQFVANVCHIEAAEEGGERFNSLQSDEDRRSYGNLLLLCYQHHVETNNTALYPVDRLHAFKAEHEKAFGQKLYKIDESLLHKVAFEMESYWHHIDELHRIHVAESDLAMTVNSKASFLEAADQARLQATNLATIQAHLIEDDQVQMQAPPAIDAATAYESKLSTRTARGPNNFEMLYLGFTNTLGKLNIALVQMELKFLEAHLKLSPFDSAARRRLELRKEEFANLARHAGHAD